MEKQRTKNNQNKELKIAKTKLKGRIRFKATVT